MANFGWIMVKGITVLVIFFSFQTLVVAQTDAVSGGCGNFLRKDTLVRPEWFDKAIVGVYPSLYQHAYSLVRKRSIAEDLAHSTIVNALTYYKGFNEGTDFRAWIHKILQNLFYMRIRSKDVLDHPVFFIFKDLDDDTFVPPVRPEAETLVELKELIKFLELLSEQELEAISVTFDDEFSLSQYADFLQMSDSKLKRRILRTRLKLMSWMDGSSIPPKARGSTEETPLEQVVLWHGHEIRLTSAQFRFIQALCKIRDKPVTSADLILKVWPDGSVQPGKEASREPLNLLAREIEKKFLEVDSSFNSISRNLRWWRWMGSKVPMLPDVMAFY